MSIATRPSRRWCSRSRTARRSTTRPSIRDRRSDGRQAAVTEFLQQLVNGITWGSVYALIALGYTMVYGILRLINFAHGDVYMLGAFFGFYAARLTGAAVEPNPLKAAGILLISMVGCGLVGFLIERFAYKPVRKS